MKWSQPQLAKLTLHATQGGPFSAMESENGIIHDGDGIEAVSLRAECKKALFGLFVKARRVISCSI